jgi:outer membrane immunogenic protein
MASGGFAFGEAKSSTTITQSCPVACAIIFDHPATGSASKTLTGWALGGGMEYALTTSWSVKAEYLHYDLGSMTFATTPLASRVPVGPFTTINIAPTANFRGDIVRVGLNYKFGNYYAPVVTK